MNFFCGMINQICEIEKGESLKNSEICCMASRACCIYCIEECPIKDVYKDFIKKMRKKTHDQTT